MFDPITASPAQFQSELDRIRTQGPTPEALAEYGAVSILFNLRVPHIFL